jgi:dTDP-4-dehydrorhamnose reductase
MTLRLLVTGTQGQLARCLVSEAIRHPAIAVTALGRPHLDLENPASIDQAITAVRPHMVVNAAAFTAVDKAEHEAERSFLINRDGAAAVARAASANGAALVQISTDYVYDGRKATPYLESDETEPIGVYGASKLAGEQAARAAHETVLIFRTSWVFSAYGTNFVKTMLRLSGERTKLRVVADQQGNPTAALDLARAILSCAPQIVEERRGGVYHAAGEGYTSWYGLAREVFSVSSRRGGPTADVEAITTAEFPTAARRPANSRLDTRAFYGHFGLRLPQWEVSVEEAVTLLVKRKLCS